MRISLILLIASHFAVAIDAAVAAPEKPDIVIFLADDMGYVDVGFNGCEDIPTPHIDALAASGAVLEQFYVQTVCSPTRAALMTGRYPMRYGLQQGVIRPHMAYGLPLGERMLPQALREAGYTTAISGKWHLGEYHPSFLPTRRGFDFQYGHFFGMLDFFTHLRDGQLDWYRNDEPCHDEGYTTHLIAREAVRVVRKQPRDKPLFLYVAFNAVHSPYHTAPGREDDFAKLNPARREYATMQSEMDTAIGQVLKALDKTGRRENALILFSSDNGGVGPADNGPLRSGKGSPYEGGHRVAACAAWDGRIEPGSRIAEPLHIVDLFPTVAGIAGVPIDSEHQPRPFDGLDILPVLTNGATSPHEEILLGCEPSQYSLRAGDWKLVIDRRSKKGKNARKKPQVEAQPELFNLANDPSEQVNLACENPEKLVEMKRRLARFQSEAVEIHGDPSGKVED